MPLVWHRAQTFHSSVPSSCGGRHDKGEAMANALYLGAKGAADGLALSTDISQQRAEFMCGGHNKGEQCWAFAHCAG